jgi:hypothetical protein
VATITINTAETIEFREAQPNLPPDASFVTVQLGKWELDNRVETGIIVDSNGLDVPPTILSANNARKLAKWLTRAADQLDATGSSKSAKKRHYYEQDDDDYGLRPGK